MTAQSRRSARIVGFIIAGTLMVAGIGSARTSSIVAGLVLMAGLALMLALVPHLFSIRIRLILAALTIVLIVASSLAAPPNQPRITAQPTPTMIGAAKPAAT